MRIASLLLLVGLASCSLGEIDFAGKTCSGGDCPGSLVCDPVTSRCVEPDDASRADAGTDAGVRDDCAEDADCPAGAYCNAGSCAACATDKHCGPSCMACGPQTPTCRAGTCTPCQTHSECGPGASCCNGSCVTSLPRLAAVSPFILAAGSVQTEVDLVGTGFTACSQVQFNGTDVPAAFLSAGSLRATLPASALQSAGTFAVQVINPGPGGGASNPNSATLQPPVTLAAGSQPLALAYHPGTGRLFVAARGAQAVLVVNLEERKVVETIALPARPVDLAADGDTALVALEDARVALLDLANSRLSETIELAAPPLAIDLDLAGQTAAVAQRQRRYQLIELAARKALAQVSPSSLGCCEPSGIGLSLQRNRLVFPMDQNQLNLIDLSDQRTTAVRTNVANRGVTVDRLNHRAYVASADSVSILDLARQTLIGVVPMAGAGWLVSNPLSRLVAGVPVGQGYSVAIVDGGSQQLAGTLGRGGTRGCSAREGIALDAAANRVFTSSSCDGAIEAFNLNVIFVR